MKQEPPTASGRNTQALGPLVLGALGVVYGDIGTSPLYTLRLCFADPDAFPVSEANIFGFLSLIVWSLIVVVTLKYVTVILKAGNRGEGGVLALMALVNRLPGTAGRLRGVVLLAGIVGVALFLGDAAITPAISVLSAIEGLEVGTPFFRPYIVPIALAVLVSLFLIQSAGTESIGRLFGPVMLVWFATLGTLGVVHIAAHPGVLLAFDPRHAVAFVASHGWWTVFALAAVVLAITGAEALYADMGHFGRRSIRTAWLVVVFPGLVLNYLGQGALLLDRPGAVENPFFSMAPEWFLYPLIALATLATVIASQAVITAAFSIVSQGVQLGFFPRLEIRHTSAATRGQIYLPRVNWLLMAAVLGLILGFRSSEDLGAAYGIAVTGTMAITTLLATLVAIYRWRWPVPAALAVFGLLLAVDLVFFASNVLKIAEGGWIAILFATVVFALMLTWVRGRRVLYAMLQEQGMALPDLLRLVESPRIVRVSGTAVYLSRVGESVPHALLHNLKHNKALHERVLLLSVVTENVPEVGSENRYDFAELGGGIYRTSIHYGFWERPDVPRALKGLPCNGFAFDPQAVSYMVGRVRLVEAERARLPRWQRGLFGFATRNALSAPDFYRLPPNQVVELGAQLAI